MQQIVSDLSEQMAELGQSAKKSFINDLVKGIPKAAKQQIFGSTAAGNSQQQQSADGNQPLQSESSKDGKNGKNSNQSKSGDDKKSPVTGAPVPSKQVLTQLTDAVDKLEAVKLKKIREELTKQRNKVKDPSTSSGQVAGQTGSEIPVEKNKLNPNAVTDTLNKSRQTGEFGRAVGG